VPISPLVRPEDDEERRRWNKPVRPEDDDSWKELVKCGGAGNKPDAAEEQSARYSTDVEDSIETDPGNPKYMLRDPDLIVTCSSDYTIRTWEPKNDFKQVQVFEGHLNMVNCVVPYRGDKLLSCSDDFTVRLWKLGSKECGELLMTTYISDKAMYCVCPLPGQRAACGGSDKVVRVISLVTGVTLHKIIDHGNVGPDGSFMQREGCGFIRCVLHLRGNLLASCSDDSTIRLWDVDAGKCLGVYAGHKGYGGEIDLKGEPGQLSQTFSPVYKLAHTGKHGKQFASCSWDRTIVIWDASDVHKMIMLRSWKAAENSVLHLCLCSERHLAACSADNAVRVWDVETGTCVQQTVTRGYAMATVRLQDKIVVIAGGDCTMRVYDWTHGKDLKGELGFYAHDAVIRDANPIFLSDADSANWTQQPIMYRTCPHKVSIVDTRAALSHMRKIWKDAIVVPLEF